MPSQNEKELKALISVPRSSRTKHVRVPSDKNYCPWHCTTVSQPEGAEPNDSLLDTWQTIDALKYFPGLTYVNLMGILLLEQYSNQHKRQLRIERIPNIQQDRRDRRTKRLRCWTISHYSSHSWWKSSFKISWIGRSMLMVCVRPTGRGQPES